ncbi:MAG: site-2 protease family protein [Thermoleophilaceae bacterium]|nr:site-2 protease family protein [Thermoleophilaceae bacterium]
MWKSTIVIARVRGIEIGINWTWIFIFALLVWSLSANLFPELAKDLPTATYWVMGTLAAVLFFTSLILHELGHAFQALREGMRIEGITLWLFGGVAKFSGMFPSAGAEFRVAIAGPLVTLAIAIVAGALAAIPGTPGSIYAVVYWLAFVNATLLVFNLLPAFPMDGGRVLRAAIWQRKQDFARATELAGATGRFFGQFFIAGGIAMALLLGAPGGLWLALIGWFVINAGQAEVQMARVRTTFAGMTVTDLMVKEPRTLPEDLTIERFEEQVLPRTRFRAYPVEDRDGTTIGLLRSQTATQTPRREWSTTTVSDRMVPIGQALVVDSTKPLSEAAIELMQTEPGRALVMDNGRLHGLLSITDIARWLDILRRP